MIGRAGVALAALLAPLSALAAEVTEFSLPNGLQAVVIEDHRAPVVVHMVWYRAGAAEDPAGHSGVAHFLEHLMFQGSANLAPGELSATVEATGGSDNAFTSWDYTAYFQRVAREHLGRMMEMEADRMLGLRLAPDEVATERDVIVQERAQRSDSEPVALFREEMAAALFRNHPYGRPVIGWQHEIATLDEAAAEAFYRAHYAPDNAILVVAGDVTPEEVQALAETHYGPLPARGDLPSRLRPQEPPPRGALRLTMADPRVSEPLLLRLYPAPERNPGDQRRAAAASLLAALLGGNPTTALLPRALQFDAQIAVYAGAGHDGTSLDGGELTISVVPLPEVDLAKAEKALDEVLARFLAEGVDVAELDRIKAQVRADDVYAQDSTQGLAERYGAALAVGLTVGDVAAWPVLLQEITADEVMEAARAILRPEHSVTGWLTAGEAP